MYDVLQLKELQRQHKEMKKQQPNYNSPIALAKLTSDPIFGSGDGPLDWPNKKDGKRDVVAYPDPDEAGLDEDIAATQKNIKSSEKYWQHTWDYDFSHDMPNFAIPGKPEYSGEKRIILKTFGPWHIPFYTDEGASVAQASNSSNSTVTLVANSSNNATVSLVSNTSNATSAA
jgi:hypothetical protein